MTVSFAEIKTQMIERQKQILALCRKNDLDINDFILKTYHKFFDKHHKSKYKYYRANLCDTLPFKENLRKLENLRKFQVINIHDYNSYYQITFVDLEKLNSRIDKSQLATKNQQIEVEIQ